MSNTELNPAAARAARPRRGGSPCSLTLAGCLLLANHVWSIDSLTNEWSIDIRYSSQSSPALGKDGTIYFGAWDGKLWALAPDGTRKWTFRTGREVRSSPALGDDGTVYVGSRDRKFYAVGPDGRKKWEFTTGGWVDASPAIGADGTVYFGSWDTNFYALNRDGSRKWQFPTGGIVDSSAAIDSAGRIYFGSHDKNLYALEPDGKKAWSHMTGGPILSSPALDRDGHIFFTSVDGFLYGLNRDGGQVWRLQTGGITASSPVLGADGTIYLGVNAWIWAISPGGAKLWEHSTEDANLLVTASPTSLTDGSVIYVSDFASLTDLGADHQRQWSFYLWEHRFASPAIGPAGAIYISGEWTNFFALRASVPLAQSAWPKFRADARNTGNVSPAGR